MSYTVTHSTRSVAAGLLELSLLPDATGPVTSLDMLALSLPSLPMLTSLGRLPSDIAYKSPNSGHAHCRIAHPNSFSLPLARLHLSLSLITAAPD